MPTIPKQTTEKESILALIKEAKAFLTKGSLTLHDHHSLKNEVAKQELQEEVTTLTTLMERSNWVELFTERCKARAVWNANTALSFCNMPHGASNQLYSKITTLLFKPSTMGELLQRLLPEAVCVTHDLVWDGVKDRRPHTDHLSIRFKKQLLNTLTQPPQLEDLANYILLDNLLLDARDLANFNFDLHQIYHQELIKTYPNLANHLYQQNSALRALRDDLLMVSDKGKTPDQVIRSFIIELKLGGSSITGKTQANLSTQVAFTEFKAYLELLPTATKNELFALSQGKILSTINHLNGGNCVEIAAGKLQSVIDDPNNHRILTTHPHFSEQELSKLKKKYGPHHLLPVAGGEANTHLPSVYLDKVVTQIHIADTNAFLSILLSFPPEFYSVLLQKVRLPTPPLPWGLDQIIATGVLNHEQLTAFHSALIIASDRFGGVSKILSFTQKTSNADLLKKWLQTLPLLTDKLGGILQIIDFAVFTNSPDLLEPVLQTLPEAERLAAVKKKITTAIQCFTSQSITQIHSKSLWRYIPKQTALLQ